MNIEQCAMSNGQCAIRRPKKIAQPGTAAWFLALLLFLGSCDALHAAELTLRVLDKEPPKDLDASISVALQKKAVQLLEGDKPVYEFWFTAELSLQTKPASLAKALDAIKQATLLGAVAVPKTQRDYRDDELAAGVYTMRFALQ